MILVTGPAYSGKREYAAALAERMKAAGTLPDPEGAQIETEVQDLADGCSSEDQLEALALLLASADIVTASETGGGIVPVSAKERSLREKQGRLLQMLAGRADTVVRVFYGLPELLKGDRLP